MDYLREDESTRDGYDLYMSLHDNGWTIDDIAKTMGKLDYKGFCKLVYYKDLAEETEFLKWCQLEHLCHITNVPKVVSEYITSHTTNLSKKDKDNILRHIILHSTHYDTHVYTIPQQLINELKRYTVDMDKLGVQEVYYYTKYLKTDVIETELKRGESPMNAELSSLYTKFRKCHMTMNDLARTIQSRDCFNELSKQWVVVDIMRGE